MKEGSYPVITIDGASGTGKGTVAHLLAQQLGWKILDSGALYRVLALAAAKHHVQLDNEKGLYILAGHLDVQFFADPARIILEGEDVSDALRQEEVGNNASIVAAFPSVRAALINRQRAFREAPGLVADGRDMGEVIFPDAIVKIFLTASSQERAMRRFKQLKALGIDVNLSDLEKDMGLRDKRDQERRVAPLKPAPGAICFNTDQLTAGEVVKKILDEIK